MKKINLLMSLAVVSGSAFGAVNGTTVEWSEYNDMATFNCSGTLIGGRYLITAAHCSDDSAILYQDGSTGNGSAVTHPLWNGTGGSNYDVAIFELANRYETTEVHFFADLNSSSVTNNEHINIFGFAGTSDTLSYATVQADTTYNVTYPDDKLYKAISIGQGETKGGDSGGAWLNADGDIIAVHNSSAIEFDADNNPVSVNMFGANLSESKTFILEQVDGWHFPTSAEGKSLAITVQSLHRNAVADSAYTDGDIQIVGGSCVGQSVIEAFDKCTYEITASGEGKLYLSANEYVHINKQQDTDTGTDTGESGKSGGSGGGSLGFTSLLALFLLRRRAK